MDKPDELSTKIAEKTVVVGVIGLGYVGLPLAMAFSEVGISTVGFDSDMTKIQSLLRSRSYIDDISSERVTDQLNRGKFRPTNNPSELAEADAVFICVPTPFDKAKNPDLSYVISAAETISEVLRPGVVVILQSTTYPGTTREVVSPILEKGSGLKAGEDFYLAFSPERVDPGNTRWNVANTPKVVGGLSLRCTQIARDLLQTIVSHPGFVVEVSSPDTAEMAKILENTYRAVNIALVNELAMLAHEMGIDIWEVIEAASTKPFGFQKFLPGIGPGGHCIPIDPHYLAWKAREKDFQVQFIEIAADVNTGMADYVVRRIQDQLNNDGKSLKGCKILCLGAAFKSGVSDTRHSRSIRVMELLIQKSAEVEFHDPLVEEVLIGDVVRHSITLNDQSIKKYDLIAILVASDSWPVENLIDSGVQIFDAVNCLNLRGQRINVL